MNHKLRRRWIIATSIWLAAFGLTYWNMETIEAIGQARQANEQLRKEIFFQHQHAQELEQVAAAHTNLFLEAESIDLGLIAVKRRIETLSADFGLTELALCTETNAAQPDRVPCSLTLRGSFERVVGFLAALQPHAYLAITQSTLTVSEETHAVDLKLAFSVHMQNGPMTPEPAPAEPLANPTEQNHRATGELEANPL